MPSWIGPWEIAIVVVIALLVFGPRKLPELGQSLGKSITGFKKGLKDSQDELKSALNTDGTETTTETVAAPAATAAPVATATPVATVAPVQASPVAPAEPVVTQAAAAPVAETVVEAPKVETA
jgi:sec-independent protein translocase protein TatA